MNEAATIPAPFPLDFDVDDDPCLICGAELDAAWRCPSCGADHFEGVMLLIGYGSPKTNQTARLH
ncbi:hypothetical protein PANO111632_17195 [Paracoccus nototheniae]|uniref:Zinc ribbon domain-containing protein n=1 Tax=Paracoccus nototheniae TaxID=2489002 RepID=A0ABW4DYW5_9RHOB|nr:hypothetical protein [Paracoccus nototheniae]